MTRESAPKVEPQTEDGRAGLLSVAVDANPEVTYQGLNTSSKSVLKHSGLLNKTQVHSSVPRFFFFPCFSLV